LISATFLTIDAVSRFPVLKRKREGVRADENQRRRANRERLQRPEGPLEKRLQGLSPGPGPCRVRGPGAVTWASCSYSGRCSSSASRAAGALRPRAMSSSEVVVSQPTKPRPKYDKGVERMRIEAVASVAPTLSVLKQR